MYVKLFGSILDSSIWAQDSDTRVVWITMLAMADSEGIVNASIDGLAHRARVSIPACRHALHVLSGPDDFDRSGEGDGHRIEALRGGWQLVNYALYRELRSVKQVQDAMRQRRHRAKEAGVTGVTERDAGVTSVTDNDVTTEADRETEAEAEAQAEADRSVDHSINQSPMGERIFQCVKQHRGSTSPWTTAFQHILDGKRGYPHATPDELDVACEEFVADPAFGQQAPNLRHFKGFVTRVVRARSNGANGPRRTTPGEQQLANILGGART